MMQLKASLLDYRSANAQSIHLAAVIVSAVVVLVAMFWIIGEGTVEGSPEMGAAVGFVVGWLTPLIGLMALNLFVPRIASVVMAVLVVLLLVTSAATIFAEAWVRSVEETRGPLLLLGAITLFMTLTALGVPDPESAGRLLVIGVVGFNLLQGIALITTGELSIILVLLVTSLPFFVIGLLLLISARLEQNARKAVAIQQMG